MTIEMILAWAAFFMAAYSVMGNDAPAQVLGTLIASHPNKRWILWLGSSVLLVFALVFSWVNYGGDISFGRLERIPHVPMEWYYLLGPIGLLLLTRFGVPVSTSFMMLSMFSAGLVLEKIIIKSMVGYGLALIVALSIWMIMRKFSPGPSKPANMKLWRPLQYISTGTLWWFWLSHDLANVAVFLPRQLSIYELIVISVVMVGTLGYIFREAGGKVHKFVFKGETDMDIRVATRIDAIYALLLFVFKEWSNIPMSTTWVFIGLMAGRELGNAVWKERKDRKKAVKVVAQRLGMITFGAVVSLLLVGLIMMLKGGEPSL
ncbi:MAG: hypothetical protein MRY32_06055 [Rickettsiales bacterium]|nr:hypothetical protein [Rickettsiales bacterium]